VHVYQIYVTEPGGSSTDEFLHRVQQAAAGPPWHVDDPPIVCSLYLTMSNTHFLSNFSHSNTQWAHCRIKAQAN